MKCRVPEEVAVCGYGNEPSTEVTFPALTTVNKDGYRVGNIAAGLLIRRIEDKEEVPDSDPVVETRINCTGFYSVCRSVINLLYL